MGSSQHMRWQKQDRDAYIAKGLKVWLEEIDNPFFTMVDFCERFYLLERVAWSRYIKAAGIPQKSTSVSDLNRAFESSRLGSLDSAAQSLKYQGRVWATNRKKKRDI